MGMNSVMKENVMHMRTDAVINGSGRIVMIDKNCESESVIIDGF